MFNHSMYVSALVLVFGFQLLLTALKIKKRSTLGKIIQETTTSR